MSYSHLPLTALRAFEATARLLSVKDAAVELHVTPTAISHQIQQLERLLGVTLFLRLHRGLALTPAATLCLPQLKAGFEALQTAVQTLQANQQSDMVSVSAPPSFAMRVLMPLTHDFLADHPEVDLRITTRMREPLRDARVTADEIDVLRRWTEENDVVIVLGKGAFGDLHAQRLMPLSIALVCSPALAEQGGLKDPDDVLRLPWLHDDRGTKYGGVSFWSQWLQQAGLEVPQPPAASAAHYSHAAMAIDAAVRGKGLLVTTPNLCRAELTAGTLIAPFDLRVAIDHAYYVLARPTGRPIADAFVRWLSQAIQPLTA